MLTNQEKKVRENVYYKLKFLANDVERNVPLNEILVNLYNIIKLLKGGQINANNKKA